MVSSNQRLDIAEELEARGDELSLRAARYIRIKRHMMAGVSEAYRNLGEKILREERCPTI
jgi:repressor of nif and glnA expression